MPQVRFFSLNEVTTYFTNLIMLINVFFGSP